MSLEVKDGNGTLRTMNTVVTDNVHTPVHNPQGEILEALQAMRMALEVMARSLTTFYPDAGGRLRVITDSASSNINTITTVSTVTALTTVATLTNSAQVGGIAANTQIPSIMNMNANDLRRNISVT